MAYLNCYLCALVDATSVDCPTTLHRVLEDAVKVSQTKSAVAANYPYYMAAICVLFKLASRTKLSQ